MSYRPICDTWILARSKVKYYGAYPAGFLERARALLGVRQYDPVLHLCSGKVQDYPFVGYGPNDGTLDVDPTTGATYVADICADLPDRLYTAFDGADFQAVLADPPYTKDDAQHYGCGGDAGLPSARRCLEVGLSIVRQEERVGILHYVAPRPPKGVKFVALVTVFVGFENRARLYSVYEKR